MFRIAVFAAVAIGSCAGIMIYAGRRGDGAGKVHRKRFNDNKKNYLNVFKFKRKNPTELPADGIDENGIRTLPPSSPRTDWRSLGLFAH